LVNGRRNIGARHLKFFERGEALSTAQGALRFPALRPPQITL
jgi:hypothetical protein